VERRRVAVVGAGVAGIVSAYLIQRRHEVVLFERNAYLGGHTNTLSIPDGPDAGTPVDTGFIVYNERTYPLFCRFLAELGVGTRASEMSFSFHCERSGLQYAGTNLNTVFAQRRNLVRMAFLRLCADILRFNRRASRDAESPALSEMTLGQYLKQGGFGGEFVDAYLIPMGAAIWSASPADMLDFPASHFIRFFRNHGLLTVSEQPQWRTITGGSQSYVRAFRARFQGRVELNAPAERIRRDPNGGVWVKVRDREAERFDAVVIAAHADEALNMLEDPTADERRFLGAWRYQTNRVILHSDTSLLPPLRRVWSSWNYKRERTSDGSDPACLTYLMNRLQGLKTQRTYCVSLNHKREPRGDAVIAEISYDHPTYTFQSVQSQQGLFSLQGRQATYYCGSYFGNGFHEDAVRSAASVGEMFGCPL
jgi:predicted NAD/FAD-binding protein